LTGGRWIEVRLPLDRIPLYLREGALVPLAPVVNYVGERPTTEIELLVAPLAADGARRFDFVVDGQPATVTYTATGGRHQVEIALPAGIKGTVRGLGADLEVGTATP
jgi:alpha-D-xyloside xylohydrolase